MDWLEERVDQRNEGAVRSLFYVSSSRLALHRIITQELASIIDTLGLRLTMVDGLEDRLKGRVVERMTWAM